MDYRALLAHHTRQVAMPCRSGLATSSPCRSPVHYKSLNATPLFLSPPVGKFCHHHYCRELAGDGPPRRSPSFTEPLCGFTLNPMCFPSPPRPPSRVQSWPESNISQPPLFLTVKPMPSSIVPLLPIFFFTPSSRALTLSFV
jgi:hypothetical protein